jgi:hypothetical protein
VRVFLGRADGAAALQVGLVVPDHVLAEHCLWRRQISQLSECLSVTVSPTLRDLEQPRWFVMR